MPNYVYTCGKCGSTYEAVHSIPDRDNETCCGEKAKRIIATTGRPVVYEYYSESLDCHITGPKQRRDMMKMRGVEDAG